MLSAFTARPIVELKQRDKSKVESVLTHGKLSPPNVVITDSLGDRLFVGLNTGTLRIYRINEGADSDDKSVELLREQEKYSKYKIEQLAIIKEAATLVSLSGGFISTHNSSTYELQETFSKSKNATTFAVTSNIVKDQDIPLLVSRLAVAVKRRLLLWTWQDSDLLSETQELTLVSGIKTLTWATGTRLVVGLTASYVLVDVETSTVTNIVGPGSIGGGSAPDGGRFGGAGVASLGYMGMGGMVPKPLATRLKDGELLLAKDINTHFIDSEGKSLERRQIPWAAAPEAIGYSYPFLLSLNSSKGTLEVRNPETLTMLQSISLPNATQLYIPNPNISLAHAGKGFLVASERCIWRMDALGYDAQIDALVEKKRYDEALSLLGLLEDALLTDKEGRSREIKMLKAQELFELRKYRNSMDLFMEAHAPPERVISLYPAVISGNLLEDSDSESVESKAMPENEGQKDGDPDVVSSQIQKIKNVEATDKSDTTSIRSTVASETSGRRELGKFILDCILLG
jgi:Vam6/Vps39-like protein vacuolar protein sorting-associated protein 39